MCVIKLPGLGKVFLWVCSVSGVSCAGDDGGIPGEVAFGEAGGVDLIGGIAGDSVCGISSSTTVMHLHDLPSLRRR